MGFYVSNLCLDRQNFGAERLPFHSFFVKWRATDVAYIVLIFVLDWFWFENIEPYQRQFSINDLTISHPFAEHERVSGSALLRGSTVFPVLIIFAVNLLLTPRKVKFYVFYLSIVGLFVGLGTDIFITDVLKNWIGRCRPDFLARCVPREDAIKDTLYYAHEVCTTTDKDRLMDGFRTTPSGHSSISFVTFGYTTLWLMGQLMVRRVPGGAWRSVVAILPALYAAYVALSRTQDYRHHFVDVFLGTVLGSLVAWWSYRRLYPSIGDSLCYVPYLVQAEGLEHSERNEHGQLSERTDYGNRSSSAAADFYSSRETFLMTPRRDLESSAVPLNPSGARNEL